MLELMTADKVLVSADGVVAGRGLCEASASQPYLKDLMIRQAAEVFVLADASKLGRDQQQYWRPLNTRWTLITTGSAEQLAAFYNDPRVSQQRL